MCVLPETRPLTSASAYGSEDYDYALCGQCVCARTVIVQQCQHTQNALLCAHLCAAAYWSAAQATLGGILFPAVRDDPTAQSANPTLGLAATGLSLMCHACKPTTLASAHSNPSWLHLAISTSRSHRVCRQYLACAKHARHEARAMASRGLSGAAEHVRAVACSIRSKPK